MNIVDVDLKRVIHILQVESKAIYWVAEGALTSKAREGFSFFSCVAEFSGDTLQHRDQLQLFNYFYEWCHLTPDKSHLISTLASFFRRFCKLHLFRESGSQVLWLVRMSSKVLTKPCCLHNTP